MLDFEGLIAVREPVETVLHGPLQDSAALYGLLARLDMFGVQVLEVRRLHGRGKPARCICIERAQQLHSRSVIHFAEPAADHRFIRLAKQTL